MTSALALLGWPPTRRLAGGSGVRAMLAALAVTLAGSVLSALPVLKSELAERVAEAREVLGSLVIRFFFVVAATLYLALNGLVDRMPFMVWVVISYLALLPVDIRYALRSRPPRAPTPT